MKLGRSSDLLPRILGFTLQPTLELLSTVPRPSYHSHRECVVGTGTYLQFEYWHVCGSFVAWVASVLFGRKPTVVRCDQMFSDGIIMMVEKRPLRDWVNRIYYYCIRRYAFFLVHMGWVFEGSKIKNERLVKEEISVLHPVIQHPGSIAPDEPPASVSLSASSTNP